MTRQENEEFFNKVKGKAIRWSGWGDDEYFIPEILGDKDRGLMQGITNKFVDEWFIEEGFEESKSYGSRWSIDYKLTASLEVEECLNV